MKKDRKKEIVEATIRLIKKNGSNPNDVTVRDICKEAGVGVSNINYHFGSKDHLLEECVQYMIGDVIGRLNDLLINSPDTSAIGRLTYAANATATYLYANENMSRISIMTDLTNGKAGDNTEQTINAYLPLVDAVHAGKEQESVVRLKTTMLCMVLQNAFLRTDRIKAELGMDLRHSKDRERFISQLIDTIIDH